MTFTPRSVFHLFVAFAAIGLAVSYSSVYLFHIVLGLLALVLCATVPNASFSQRDKYSHLPLYIITSWFFLSTIWSINQFYALRYTFYLVCGASIVTAFVTFINNTEDIQRVLKILATIYVLQISLSLLEVFTDFRLPISPFSNLAGFFGREYKLDQGLTTFQIAYLHTMPTGFHWNPNNLSAVLIITLPFFLFYPKTLTRIAGSTSILILIIAAGSRAAFLSFVLVVAIWAYWQTRTTTYVLGLLTILTLTIFGIQYLKNSDNYNVAQIATAFDAATAYLSGDFDSDSSIGIRKRLISDGLSALRDTYGFGLGGGGSVALQEELGTHRRVTSMHNFWLEMLVEGGVLAGALFCSWYFYIIVRLIKIGRTSNIPILCYTAKSLSTSFCGFAFAMIGASTVVYTLPMWIMFGLSCAIVNIRNECKPLPIASNGTSAPPFFLFSND